MDSRYWGFVPESDIVGKAVLVLFSYTMVLNGIDYLNQLNKRSEKLKVCKVKSHKV